jgi:hypothetical protein
MKIKTLNVVMIATDKPTNIVLNTINNKLLLDNDKTLVERILPINGKNQHLYFTSNDEIKEGEVCPYIMCWTDGSFELFNSNNSISESKRLCWF